MAGYNDTKQKIINTLAGRPAGVEIQPEAHQGFALDILEYVRSVELTTSSSLIGIAEEWTMPVQPNSSKVSYIAGISQNKTLVFTNFRGSDGLPITVKTGDMEGFLIVLIWNTEYWSASIFPTNIITSAEVANYYIGYTVKQTYVSTAALNADVENPIGIDGRLIRLGDVVTVINPLDPSENAFYSRVDGAWQFQMQMPSPPEQTEGFGTGVTMSQLAIGAQVRDSFNRLFDYLLVSENLINSKSIIDGKALSDVNGEFIQKDPTWNGSCVSSYIDVKEGSTYKLYSIPSNAWLYSYHFYDAQCGWISKGVDNIITTGAVVPNGAKYIRICWAKTSGSGWDVNIVKNSFILRGSTLAAPTVFKPYNSFTFQGGALGKSKFSELEDVSNLTPTENQVWGFDGTKWFNRTLAAAHISDLQNAFSTFLGAPAQDGYLLSSLINGTKSWVAPYSHPDYANNESADGHLGHIKATKLSAIDRLLSLFERKGAGTELDPYVIEAKYDFYSIGGSSAYGLGVLGGGGGSGYDRLDEWEAYDSSKAGWVLSAALGYDLKVSVDGKASSSHSHSWTAITDKPTAFNPLAHSHAISEVAELSTALSGKESGLGNPSSEGQILSSTLSGVRSWVNRYVLPVAAADVLGGVMIGSNISVNAQGLISVAAPYSHPDYSIETGIGGSLGHIKASERTAWNDHKNSTTLHLSSTERTYLEKLMEHLKFAVDYTSMYSKLNFYSESGVSAYGIGDGGSGGGGVNLYNGLDKQTTGFALDAYQGYVLKGLVDGKAAIGHTHLWANITDKPSAFTPAAHSHDYLATLGTAYDSSRLGGQLPAYYVATNDSRLSDARTPLPHTHDGRYSRIYGGGTTIDANTINEVSSITEYRWLNAPYNGIGILTTNNNYASNWVTQEFAAIQSNKRWFRNYNGSNVAWSNWFEYYHSGNTATIKTDLGLGSAAYTATTAYDSAGAASTVQGNLNTHINNNGTSVHGLGSASLKSDTYFATATALGNHIGNAAPHLSSIERTYLEKLMLYFKFAVDYTSMYSTINFYSESGVSAFGIGSGGGGGGANVLDTLTSTSTIEALSANMGRELNVTKQALLNGIGLVRMSGTNLSYDNTTYVATNDPRLSDARTPVAHNHNQIYSLSNLSTQALLVNNRTDDEAGSAWIYWDALGGSTNPWGIKHNQPDNYIEFYGAGNKRAYVDLNSGSGKVLVGSDIGNSVLAYRTFGTAAAQDVGYFAAAAHSHTGLVNPIWSTLALNALNFAGGFSARPILLGSSNIFPTVNNANAVLTVDMYDGSAAAAFQLGFSSSGNFYSRYANGTWYKVWSELNFTPANYALLAGSTSQPFSASTLGLSGALTITTDNNQMLLKASGTVDRTAYFGMVNNNTINQRVDVGIGGTGNGLSLVDGEFYIYDYVTATRRLILTKLGAATFASTVSASGFTASGYTVFHSGNLTQNLTSGYLPYWDGSSLSKSVLKMSDNTLFITERPVHGGFYLLADQSSTGTASFHIQAGQGSGSFGGSVSMYGHSHTTKAGWVTIGLSGVSGAKFSIQDYAIGSGNDVFTVDRTGAATFASSVSAGGDFISGINRGIKWDYLATNTAYIRMDSSVSAYGILIGGHGEIRFRTNHLNVGDTDTATRMYIANNGNVDIGYLGARGEKFAVNGSVYFNGTLQATSVKIGASWEAIPNGTSDVYLDLKYGGVLKARLDSSGNITAVGGMTCFAT